MAHGRARPRPLGRGVLRPGPAAGLAELADEVVVVAAEEDASLVRLTMDHVIDHDGQVLSVSATPGPGARTLCRDADRAGCRPCEHEHGRQPVPACGCSPADAQPARTRPRNRPPICLRHAHRGGSVLQRRHWAAVTDGGGGSTCRAQVADMYRRCSFGFASAGRAELATMCPAADKHRECGRKCRDQCLPAGCRTNSGWVDLGHLNLAGLRGYGCQSRPGVPDPVDVISMGGRDPGWFVSPV
jgi:hypothetical protein